MSVVVYEATCRENNSRYIGVSKNLRERKRSHACAARQGSKALFHRAIRKRGIDAFDFAVRAELPTSAEAMIAERILIALEKPRYNMTAGGEGAPGAKLTAERRAQQSACMTGRKHTTETKNAIGAAHRGKTVSADTRAKMSVSAKQRDPSTHPMRGKHHSAETRAKISAAKTGVSGQPISAETKAKMSAAQKARWALRKQG